MSVFPDPAQMRFQPRRFLPALVPLAVGLLWLAAGWQAPWIVAILATGPAVVLIASGAGQWLWPGDRQLCYHMALAAVVSTVLAVLIWFWLGFIAGALLIVGSAVTFLVAGLALRIQQSMPGAIDAPGAGIILLAKIATDAAILGLFINCARIPRGRDVDTDLRELDVLARLIETRGWDTDPAAIHQTPTAPADARSKRVKSAGQTFDWLTFPSAYVPDPELPGSQRWLAHEKNRIVGARVFRHEDDHGDRPWLMCIHGYRMGLAALDFQLFDVARLHHKLGLNVIMPILPLHGSRSESRITGGLFLDGPMADLVHAEAQSLNDLRACLAWVREQAPGAPVGVLGYSLGGYNAALLSAFEADLACVIAGIPLTDIPQTLWQHMPLSHSRYLEASGLTPPRVGAQLAMVSPLTLDSQVARDKRFIFAATTDQLVSPDQPLRLWRHWEEPALQWYDGSHLSVRHEADVRPFIDNALASCGLIRGGAH